MALSMPDPSSQVQVPGFRDRFGERVIVPQPSGALLEYLYFVDLLADAPFFAQALKYRVARLSSFAHSSYCRVRRVQQMAERDDRHVLVSAHVAGRRLAEVLEVARQARVLPATPGVLAAARQMMTAVALLHDFAPDGFHGALGPDRLVLAGEGRVVIAEHVLGTVVSHAVEAWGPARLWRDLGVATLTDPALAQDGRRNDIVQVGLIVLAMLLGRPLDADEYPNELGWLLQQTTETAADGSRAPLGPGLRDWLERALSLVEGGSYTALLDAQLAFTELLQGGGYTASAAAWDSFVSVCETAALRVALPVVPAPPPSVDDAPDEAALAGNEHEALTESEKAPSPVETLQAAPESHDAFSSWPTTVPSESAATLLEKFSATDSPASVSPSPRQRPQATAAAPPAVEPPPAPEGALPKVETLFVSPAATGVEPELEPDDQSSDTQSWQAAELDAGQETAVGGRRKRQAVPPARRIKLLLVLGTLLAAATAAGVQAPRLWALVFDSQRSSGQLTIDSDPAGAAVTVDGQFRGLTPIALPLGAGTHQLDVQNGGSLQSKKISIAAHETLRERMTFPGGHDVGGLAISAYPKTGRVTVDGVVRGLAPVNVSDLTPGSHTVVVETPLGVQEQDVMVQAGKLLPLTVQTVSWVKADAPYELEVSEEGRNLGTTGKAAVVVSPGRHHLEFSNAALGLKIRQIVDTVPGQLVVAPLDLPMGTMNLTSDQPAEVYVDGQRVGETPVSGLAVALGAHEVTFLHARHGQLRYKVTATLGGPVRLIGTFRK